MLLREQKNATLLKELSSYYWCFTAFQESILITEGKVKSLKLGKLKNLSWISAECDLLQDPITNFIPKQSRSGNSSHKLICSFQATQECPFLFQ